MISGALETLALRLRPYRGTGLELAPEAVAELVTALEGLAEIAEALERGEPLHRVGAARGTSSPPWGWRDTGSTGDAPPRGAA